MSRFKDWVIAHHDAAGDELMAQLEVAQQAIVELQNERETLRNLLTDVSDHLRFNVTIPAGMLNAIRAELGGQT